MGSGSKIRIRIGFGSGSGTKNVGFLGGFGFPNTSLLMGSGSKSRVRVTKMPGFPPGFGFSGIRTHHYSRAETEDKRAFHHICLISKMENVGPPQMPI